MDTLQRVMGIMKIVSVEFVQKNAYGAGVVHILMGGVVPVRLAALVCLPNLRKAVQSINAYHVVLVPVPIPVSGLVCHA